jgi:hypothetical protein
MQLERKLQGLIGIQDHPAGWRICTRRKRVAGFDIFFFILLRDLHMPLSYDDLAVGCMLYVVCSMSV